MLSLISLSNSLYTKLYCQEGLYGTVGVSVPFKELSLGPSVVKRLASLTLKNALSWGSGTAVQGEDYSEN